LFENRTKFRLWDLLSTEDQQKLASLMPEGWWPGNLTILSDLDDIDRLMREPVGGNLAKILSGG